MTTQTVPTLRVVPKPEKAGHVEPVLMVGLQPTRALLEQAATFEKPHYLVIVSSIDETNHYDTGTTETRYMQRDAHVFSMTTRQTQYVTFHRPGRHRITACIVEAKNNEKALTAIKHDEATIIRSSNGELIFGFLPESAHMAEAYTEVDVSPDLFAPPPTGLRRKLVMQYARNQGVDECNFFWRSVGAIALTGIIQTVGLVLRPPLLIMAMLMLRHEIRYKQFFAFFPTTLWSSAGESAWFESKNGVRRRNQEGWRQLLPFLCPPAWIGYIAVFFAVPSAVFGLSNVDWTGGDGISRWNYWGYWETFVITYKWIGLAILLIATVGGTFLTSKLVVNKLRNKPVPPKTAMAQQKATHQYRLERLRQSTIEITNVEAIPPVAQSGPWLTRFKRKHCRPYITE